MPWAPLPPCGERGFVGSQPAHPWSIASASPTHPQPPAAPSSPASQPRRQCLHQPRLQRRPLPTRPAADPAMAAVQAVVCVAPAASTSGRLGGATRARAPAAALRSAPRQLALRRSAAAPAGRMQTCVRAVLDVTNDTFEKEVLQVRRGANCAGRTVALMFEGAAALRSCRSWTACQWSCCRRAATNCTCSHAASGPQTSGQRCWALLAVPTLATSTVVPPTDTRAFTPRPLPQLLRSPRCRCWLTFGPPGAAPAS